MNEFVVSVGLILNIYGAGAPIERWETCKRDLVREEHSLCTEQFAQEEFGICTIHCPPYVCDFECAPWCLNIDLCLESARIAQTHAQGKILQKRAHQARVLKLMQHGACPLPATR